MCETACWQTSPPEYVSVAENEVEWAENRVERSDERVLQKIDGAQRKAEVVEREQRGARELQKQTKVRSGFFLLLVLRLHALVTSSMSLPIYSNGGKTTPF